MNERQKARTDAATSTRAGAKNQAGCASFFSPDFITARSGRQGRVAGLLRPGAANAIPTERLVELAGFRSARELQQQIARERETGALILSKSGDGGGYFLASTKEELRAFERTLTRRALSTLSALRSTRLALDRLDGQTELPGVR